MSGSLEPWKGFMKPVQIWGNLYFVGTRPASSHIIDTGDGLIMLDSGYQHSLYLVLHNMYTLGLDPMQIKYIVHTHGHIDHCGATAALVQLTDAKTFLGEPDADFVNGKLPLSWAKELDLELEPFEADVLLKDGDRICLGNTEITAVATPGHTPGTMSFLFDVHSDNRTLCAGLNGGTGINTMKREFLDAYKLPYSCRQDFVSSMDKLSELHVDIFLSNHIYQGESLERYEKLVNGDRDVFVDQNAWKTYAQKCKHAVLSMLEKETLG